MDNRLLLISVDGVSYQQWSELLKFLPLASKMLSEASGAILDTRPFVEAQPIWAEILTGTRWYENGCSSYAHPDLSLNKLEVFNETLLSTPVTLVQNLPTTVCINVPLLLPLQRTWIADGSLPILSTASPPELSNLFDNRYKPRPYASLAAALRDGYQSASQLIQVEMERLNAAVRVLVERPWNEAVLRITAFDQLQHIFGPHALLDPNLLVHRNVQELLGALNRFFAEIAKTGCQIACISAFSHSMCRSRFNVNALLRRAAYLSVEKKPAFAANRTHAVSSMSGLALSPVSLGTSDGHLSVSTRAASPVGGNVFLNRARAFTDGTVGDTEVEALMRELKALFEDRLYYYFGGRGSIFTRPQSSSPVTKHALPEFILHVPDVEFFDGSDIILDNQDKPLVCHQDKGFLVIGGMTLGEESITPIEANHVLRKIGFGN